MTHVVPLSQIATAYHIDHRALVEARDSVQPSWSLSDTCSRMKQSLLTNFVVEHFVTV